MSLLSNTGPLDKVSAMFALSFTTAWMGGVVFNIPVAESMLLNFYTMFGMFDKGGDIAFDKSHVAAASGAYCLPILGMCLPVVLGTEGTVHRHSRQVVAFWLWLGWLFYHIRFLLFDTGDSFSGSPANYFWLINNSVMVFCHYQWVGQDILGKFHLGNKHRE